MASGSSGNVCQVPVGIQDEVLGGQRPTVLSKHQSEQEEQFVGSPCLLLTAEPPRAQPTSSKALQKGSIRHWEVSSATPPRVRRPRRM